MKFNHKSEKLSIENIANYLNDLENIDSFFILERGNCSYLQCINYKGSILIEERIYSKDSFKHYILGYGTEKSNDFKENNLEDNELIIEDKFFRRFSNELFSIEEAIDIFTDYYTNIPFKNIVKRDVTSEFGKLEKGFIFVQWLDSAVDRFKETLDEFIEIIEPFIVDELKKDCIGRKLTIDVDMEFPDKQEREAIENNGIGIKAIRTKVIENKTVENRTDYGDIRNKNIKCSVFQVIDVRWAAESIIEVAEKYEFLNDIVLFKKRDIEDNEFFKINIGDFK